MKRNLWLVALVLAVSALFAKEFAKPVLAQVRAALVQDVDEPGRNIFALSLTSTNNVPSSVNVQVPAGKRYVIEQYTASCLVDSTTTLTNFSLFGTASGANTYTSTVPHLVRPSEGSFNGHLVSSWVATGNGPFYADPSTSLLVQVDSAVFGTRLCSFYLSGHIINNP